MPAPAFIPPMIRTDGSNAFAYNTMHERIPRTFRETRDRLGDAITPAMAEAVEALADGIAQNEPIPPLALPAPDADDWAAAYADHAGQTWLNTDWWFAETYGYRLLIEAVRWWETGIDPFSPIKRAEIEGAALWSLLARAAAIEGDGEKRLRALIFTALWGNRIDLSYTPSLEHGMTAGADHLLANDSETMLAHLLSGTGAVHVVADNTGTELAMDMALIDGLLAAGHRVVLHLKLHPTFVSDATVADALDLLGRFEAHSVAAVQALGQRLRRALNDGHLQLAPDGYWNSSRVLWDLPPRLERLLAAAHLVILKGDANYRRLAGDALWPPEITFKEAIGYFPAPLVTLRTMKGDTLVGLPAATIAAMDAREGVDVWRSNGRYGLIQSTL